MFSFTTQTVFNHITTGENLIAIEGKKPALRIGNTRFNKADIKDVQIKKASPEFLASVEFDMSKVLIGQSEDVAEKTGRIALYIGLSANCNDSFYSNDLLYKGKPFYIEFPIKKTDTADTLAKRVKSIADKYMLLMTQQKLLNITTTATAAVPGQGGAAGTDAVGKVKIEGTNGYQQIRKAVLQVYDPDKVQVDCCSNVGEYVDVVTGVPVAYTISGSTLTPSGKFVNGEVVELDEDTEVAILPGLEAFGDYNWIIHNLRLPTGANTDFFSQAQYEMPVVGGEYTQFVITMCVDSYGIAGQAVGQTHTSRTVHVLYVIGDSDTNNSPANKVKTALTTLVDDSNKILNDADVALNNPYNQA